MTDETKRSDNVIEIPGDDTGAAVPVAASVAAMLWASTGERPTAEQIRRFIEEHGITAHMPTPIPLD